jgi:hypothetical protein
MALQPNFKNIPLSGLSLTNPTSIQFGPDGRLYVSQQDGTIKIANISPVQDSTGDITAYVASNVETLSVIKNIPNHDDNGALNPTVENRQVTGLVVDEGPAGEIILYVSSSDPRIGGGFDGTDEELDTNSGIISRLVLTDPSQPLGDDRWVKTDLVIGLPRSEENHSTNGLDIRTEIVDGQPHKIMYVASGGFTNKGAPSSNFLYTPEYYYAAAVLRVDLTQLDQIEAAQGLLGGTPYVNPYVYALPTLDDPTRPNDSNGHDIAAGTTADPADDLAGSTFGGNNGLNQAKYDPNGPVQIYSMGYRNHYDIVITEANNIYTFDNGPNNGWGDVPLTASGVPVTPNNPVGTNNPNIDVDTGNDKGPDNLHLVTQGFYAGHPNPVYASGSAAGLYTVDTSSGSPVVTQLSGSSLPQDWNTIAGVNNSATDPNADVFIGPGNNLDGSTKGPDGSLLTINSSTNGLTEYTASGITDNPNAEVLASASFNGKITFVEILSDGTQGGTQVTDIETIQLNGTPLDLTGVGNNGINGQGLLARTLWITQFGKDAITVLTPGAPLPVDIDQDDDNLNDSIDPLQQDASNGANTILNAGASLFWDFNPSGTGQYPGPAGEFNIGMTGWMINGNDDLDGLRDLDNTIRGGAPGIIQIKSVGAGDFLGASNNQKDAIQTGFLPNANVNKFTIKVPIFNPFSSDANNNISWSQGAAMGFTLGDGSMSNGLQIAVGANNLSGQPVAAQLRVTYEEQDQLIADFAADAPELLGAVDDDQIELLLEVNMQAFQVTPKWRYQTQGVWSEIQQLGASPIQLDIDGNIVKALKGQNFINGVQSAAVVSLTATSKDSEQFTADFLDLAISASDGGTGGEEPSIPLYRINVGGSQVTAPDGALWSVDTQNNPSPYRIGSGGANIFTKSNSIDLSSPSLPSSALVESIFQTERFDIADAPNMAWAFPVVDGDYAVRLYLAEIYNPIDTVGERVFDVTVEGTLPTAFDNIDPVLLGGVDAGVMVSSVATVTDGTLNLEFLEGVQNPALKGIEILSLPTPPVLPGLSISDVTVNEDDGTATFVVSLSESSSSPVTVNYSTQSGTATENIDYTGNAGTLEFAVGETQKTITVDIEGDGDVETDETFEITLTNASGATLLDGIGTGTIVNDDEDISDPSLSALYRINVGGSQVTAPDGALWSADTQNNPSPYRIGFGGANIFTKRNSIDLSSPSLPSSALVESIFQTERFDIADAPNMAWAFPVVDGDYAVRLYLAEIYNPIDTVGERVFDVTVEGTLPTAFDNIDPVLLGGVDAGVMVSSVITVTDGTLNLEFLEGVQNPALKGIEILSLLTAPVVPGLSINDVTVNEADGTANFVVSLSESSSSPVTVDYSTQSGTATENIDYTGNAGTLEFAAGETQKTITVDIEGDGDVETNESFNIILSNASGANLLDGIGTGTILDDDENASNPPLGIEPFQNISPVDDLLLGQIGSATLVVTPNNDIQQSSFGLQSFTLTNTGDKRIAAVYLDIMDALFPDSVFDPQGLAGDSVARGLAFNTTGNTGVYVPASDKNDPDVIEPFHGMGGDSGYEGMFMAFNPNQNGGFNKNESVQFGVDIDPNSIAGLAQKPVDINGNSPLLNDWDIGGVSGAELINSKFHVLFTDGTTATGELMGNGTQSGAVGSATQNSPNKQISLTVNELNPGESGSYDPNNIQVLVSGQQGDTARVVLAKGFIQPFAYTDINNNPVDLANKFTNSPFPANQAIQFQTVDILLTGTPQDITSEFDFGSPGGTLSFPGDDQLPIGLVASIINPTDELPLGMVTEPIYLSHETGIEDTDDNTFEIILYEAEQSPSISNYRVENISAASGGKALSFHKGSENEVGQASFNFTQNEGKYDIFLGTFDESDGIAKFSLELNGQEIGEPVVLNAELGSHLPNGATSVKRLGAANIEFKSGDVLTINGFENLNEHARLDYVELVGSNNG